MGNKSINWRKIQIAGSIIGTIVIVGAVIYCVQNPSANFAILLADFMGGPINYGHISFVLIYYLLWALLLAAIRNIYEKSNAKKQSQNEAEIPGLKIWAKVVLKNSATTSHRPYLQDAVYVYDTFSITFETTDGRRLVFPLTQEQYGMYLEGDTGILTYKEINGQLTFISFERQMQPSN